MPLTTSQILKDRYRIVKLLGQGGFGAVYRAWDTTLNVPCAVKESFELSPGGQRQFLREAQILAGLRHPNLPRVTDYFALPGQGQYLVMDYIEGQDLEELRLQAGGRLPEAQVLPWIAQVCEALEYLHNQKPAVIHRDIKPANIKITPPDKFYPQGRAMLVDFGVAKVYDPAIRTTMGARAVTPGYSPHEQYGHTSAATDARTDVYALGATLYSLLTGQDPVESIMRIVSDPLAPPRSLAPTITPTVESAILKAMTMDPAKRFQSTASFMDMLLGVDKSHHQPLVAHSPAPLPASQASTPPAAAYSLSPISPATLGVPLPAPARPIPWNRVGIRAGALAGVVLLVVLGILAMKGTRDTRLTQTSQSRSTQTAAALAALPSQTPTPLPPTVTPTPSLQPPTATPTPSRIPPSPRPPSPTALPPTPYPTLVSPVDGMVLSYIPAGWFQMGSNIFRIDERPVHRVTLDAFWMDQTEVTNSMYAQCVAERECTPLTNTSSYTRSSYYGNAAFADFPVVYVNWYQASAYCTWAGRRLPTEAEWEYAARGGLEGATYPWGDEINCTRANYAPLEGVCVGDTSAVGSYGANGYGLYDMAGNVWEWVADRFGYYSAEAVENPTGPYSGDYYMRRGGAWPNDEESQRAAFRLGSDPGLIFDDIGFRCALSP